MVVTHLLYDSKSCYRLRKDYYLNSRFCLLLGILLIALSNIVLFYYFTNMDHGAHQMDGMMSHPTQEITTMDHSKMGHGDKGMDGMDGMGMDGMMKMYFHFGFKETVLFEQWKTEHAWQMVVSCIGIFILAALYEGLKVLREHLLRKYSVQVRYSAYTMPPTQNSNNSSSEAMVMETHSIMRQKMLSCSHIIQSLLHVLQIVISYFLMLIFMTYNVWLCLAIALGAGIGYFLFGWRKAQIVDVNEHCH